MHGNLIVTAFMTAVALAGGSASLSEAAGHPCAKIGAIRFVAADGTRLAGHRFGRGTTAVIFRARDPKHGLSMDTYARRLASQGYLTIAFDFRGYGDSQQRTDPAAYRLPADLTATTKVARSFGAKKMVPVGLRWAALRCG